MKSKLFLTSIILLSILSNSAAFADNHYKSGQTYHSLPKGLTSSTINCYNNPSDVCIANNSNQTIEFDVAYPSPSNPVTGPLNPPNWVDAYSYFGFNSIYVSITNASGQPIFGQYVPNHSVINVSNYQNNTLHKDNGTLQVSVH